MIGSYILFYAKMNCQSSLILRVLVLVSLTVILAATMSSSSTTTGTAAMASDFDFEGNHVDRIVHLDQHQHQHQHQHQQRPQDNQGDLVDDDFDYSTKIMDFEEWISIHKQQGYGYYDIDIDTDTDTDTNTNTDTDTEYQKRKSIYNENIIRWNELNQLNNNGGAKYGPENEKYADLTPKEFVKVVGCANNNNNDDGSNEIERESNTSTSTNAYTSDNAHYHLRAQQQQQKHQKQEAFLRSRHLISNTVSELNINNNNGDKKGDNSNSTKTNINNSNFNNTAISSSSAPITIMYIDWRNNKGVSYVTPPKNQGPYGSCWSFSAAENLEGLQVRQGYTLQNISEQEFISCCPQCRGRGTWQTFDWLINTTNGYPALEEYYPYNGNTSIACRVKDAPRAKVQLHSWNSIKDDDGTGDIILEALDRFGPMGLGVDATCFHGYKSGIIRNCTTSSTTTTTTDRRSTGGNNNKVAGGVNHAVLMVAAGTDMYLHQNNNNYNNNNEGEENGDNASPLIPSFVDFFTIKNSWGNKWGEGGYVRIERGKDFGWGNLHLIYTE